MAKPRLAPPEDMTPEKLRKWAREHLIYEVKTLVFVVLELGKKPKGMTTNALLESFVVHARCVDEFLWRDRRGWKPRDAFAADFCEAGDWEAARGPLPQVALEDVRHRNRFGREVMHLTYDRIDGAGEEKEWPCGEVLIELTTALRLFSRVALPDRLDGRTRALFGALRTSLEGEKSGKFIGGATTLYAGHLPQVPGTRLDVRGIRAGG